MKTAIRYGIIFALAFGLGLLVKELGLTHDAEGEIAWIPFVIYILLVMYGGGWLDRNLLQKWIGKD